MAGQYSTIKINDELLSEISDALKNIRGWGSVEIYVQNNEVVQITERNIKKTSKKNTLAVAAKMAIDK